MTGSAHDGDLPQTPDAATPRYVVIEGCIGVGKTTLTNMLSDRFASRTVLEKFEENPFLPEFYEDPVAHAFKTQMFFLLSRFKQQEELPQQELFEQRIVADYLFAKDRIFAELTLNPSELQLYDQVFDALSSKVPVPDLVVFLTAPLDIILQRIQQRGRPYEQNMDPDYLERLTAAYERFFARYDDCPTLIVDTQDLNFPERKADFEVVVGAALETIAAGKRRLTLSGDSRQPTLV
jgi:deoxyadenosine/deoxycytidine kinase